MKHSTLRSALALAATLGVAASAPAQEAVCPDIVDLVRQALPNGVGSPTVMQQLLSPQVGPQFPDLFLQVAGDSALPAIQSRLRIGRRSCTPDEEGMMTCRASNFRKTEFLKFEQRTGKAAYLNQRREWKSSDGNNDLPESRAIELAREVVDAWAIPTGELDPQWVEVRPMNVAGGDKLDSAPSELFRTELHVRFPRRIGGVPVFDSDVRVAIDGKGQVARLRVKWPAFGLLPGLEPIPASRDEVLERTSEELSEGAICGSLSKVEAYIAYVDASEVESFDPTDEGEVEQAATSGSFVPALVVYATAKEPAEDSGELSMAGRQITVPLLAIGGDGN